MYTQNILVMLALRNGIPVFTCQKTLTPLFSSTNDSRMSVSFLLVKSWLEHQRISLQWNCLYFPDSQSPGIPSPDKLLLGMSLVMSIEIKCMLRFYSS